MASEVSYLSPDDVRLIQSKLNWFTPTSLPRLVVDGVIGPKTRDRIREFQRQSMYLAVSGNVDHDTFASITGQVYVYGSSASDTWAGVTGGAGAVVSGAWLGVTGAGAGLVTPANSTPDLGPFLTNSPTANQPPGLTGIENTFFQAMAQYAATGNEALLSTAMDAASQLVGTSSAMANDAADAIKKYGGWLANLALMMGMSIGTATAIVAGGGLLLAVVLLKK